MGGGACPQQGGRKMKYIPCGIFDIRLRRSMCAGALDMPFGRERMLRQGIYIVSRGAPQVHIAHNFTIILFFCFLSLTNVYFL